MIPLPRAERDRRLHHRARKPLALYYFGPEAGPRDPGAHLVGRRLPQRHDHAHRQRGAALRRRGQLGHGPLPRTRELRRLRTAARCSKPRRGSICRSATCPTACSAGSGTSSDGAAAGRPKSEIGPTEQISLRGRRFFAANCLSFAPAGPPCRRRLRPGRKVRATQSTAQANDLTAVRLWERNRK